jgi:hypothetical protein
VLPDKLPLERRTRALDQFVQNYLTRGYKLNSRTATTAELYRPARYPAWLFREKTVFVAIDEIGRIYLTEG